MEQWLKENKADLRHLCAVSTDNATAFAERESTLFVETSALELMNVENALTEVLSQIYHVVSRKALDAADDAAALPKGQTINTGSKDGRVNCEQSQLLLFLRSPVLHSKKKSCPFLVGKQISVLFNTSWDVQYLSSTVFQL